MRDKSFFNLFLHPPRLPAWRLQDKAFCRARIFRFLEISCRILDSQLLVCGPAVRTYLKTLWSSSRHSDSEQCNWLEWVVLWGRLTGNWQLLILIMSEVELYRPSMAARYMCVFMTKDLPCVYPCVCPVCIYASMHAAHSAVCVPECKSTIRSQFGVLLVYTHVCFLCVCRCQERHYCTTACVTPRLRSTLIQRCPTFVAA